MDDPERGGVVIKNTLICLKSSECGDFYQLRNWRLDMKSLKSRLPPMKSLVACKAVARHLNLTRAWQELFISREAVCRQIRILEEHLGVKLFDRLHRAASLTVARKEFIAVVQSSLKNIVGASDNIQKNNQPFKITIYATVAISSFWLAQKLIKYREIHSQVEFRVVVSDT